MTDANMRARGSLNLRGLFLCENLPSFFVCLKFERYIAWIERSNELSVSVFWVKMGVGYSTYHSKANEIQGTYLEHHDRSIAGKPYVAPPRLWVIPDNMVLNVIRNDHSSSCGKSARFGSFLLASPF